MITGSVMIGQRLSSKLIYGTGILLGSFLMLGFAAPSASLLPVERGYERSAGIVRAAQDTIRVGLLSLEGDNSLAKGAAVCQDGTLEIGDQTGVASAVVAGSNGISGAKLTLTVTAEIALVSGTESADRGAWTVLPNQAILDIGNMAPSEVVNWSIDILALTSGSATFTETLTSSSGGSAEASCTITVEEGEVDPGRIVGTKWHDLDQDGDRDNNEPGLSGWTIFIDVNNNGQRDGGEPSATTKNDGSYEIEELDPKAHTVREELQDGWEQTYPSLGQHIVIVEAGSTAEGIDFGNYRTPGTADLAIDKTVEPDTVFVGERLTYTVTVTNHGPDDATSAFVRDIVFSDSLEFIQASVPSGCTLSQNNGQLECTLGTVANGQTVSIQYEALTKLAGGVRNLVLVESDDEDPNVENNIMEARAVVRGGADVSVIKTASADTVVVGDTLTYTVTVTNHGPETAFLVETDDLVFSDSLEFAPAWVPINCDLGTAIDDDTSLPLATMQCRHAAILDPGESETSTYKAVVKKAGVVSNEVTVKSAPRDLNPENNIATTSTYVRDGSVAYLDPDANGPGVLDDPNNPFPMPQDAIDAGAKTLWLTSGTFVGDVDIFGHGVNFGSWNGQAGNNLETNVPGRVTFNGNVSVNDPGGHIRFLVPTTITGDLTTNNTDDPGTVGFVEGLFAEADSLHGSEQESTIIQGDWYSFGPVGVRLGSQGNFFHNYELQGDAILDPSPVLILEVYADPLRGGNLCESGTQETPGNKVRFTGDQSQRLTFTTDLVIPSIEVNKGDPNARVEVDEESSPFLIDTSLEIIRGKFVTNGLLDANKGGKGEGATVVINGDENGGGILDRGNAERAYINYDPEFIPRKVKYTGSRPHFTADEIPGDDSGANVSLDELEIFASDPSTLVTVGKDFTLENKLVITRGILDVGSSRIRLGNKATIEVGDGEVRKSEQSGELEFPSEWIPDEENRDFRVGDDGIDLLYFGTTDRTVGLEWPASRTDVNDREPDGEVIRDVRINPVCEDDVTIRLREDDDEYRINGNLVIGALGEGRNEAEGSGFGALDLRGNVLDLNATWGAKDTVLEIHKGAYLTDSTNPLLVERPQAASKDAGVGYLRFIGSEDTNVWVEATKDRPRFDLPAVEVDKPEGHLRFEAADETNAVLGTTAFTVIDTADDNGIVVDGDLNLASQSDVTLLGGTFSGDLTLSGDFVANAGFSGSLIFNGYQQRFLQEGDLTLNTLTLDQAVPDGESGTPWVSLDLSRADQVTIEEGLSLTNGLFITGDQNTLMLPSSSGASIFTRAVIPRNHTHIVGNVAMDIPTGATGRFEYPVGSMEAFRPAVLTFGGSDPAPVDATITVNHVEQRPRGTNGFPMGAIEGPADFYWLIASDVDFGADQTFGLELLGTGFSDFSTVQDLRIISRLDGDTDNAWKQQEGAYDNIANLASNQGPLVSVVDTQGGLIPEGMLFSLGSSVPATELGSLQLIQNIVDADKVDVYLDESRLLDDFAFQTATPFMTIAEGSRKLEIVAANESDNSAPLFTANLTVEKDVNYIGVVQGQTSDLQFVVQDNARLRSSSDDVEVFMIHGTPSQGAFDIRGIDPANGTILGVLAEDLAFGAAGAYQSLVPGRINVEVLSSDNGMLLDVFHVNLEGRGGSALVGVISIPPSSSSGVVSLLFFDVSGNAIVPDVVTSSEGASEVPEVFVLHGNYPNPFNPSTTLLFDLPRAAVVNIEVVDMLGRRVLTVPEQTFSAGSGHTLAIDASPLGSGVYLYRVVARTDTGALSKTGRMTLVK